MNKTEVLDSINWEAVMAAPRDAGGHAEVMEALFADRAQVYSSWQDDSYDGELAYAYQFPDGTICIVTDYFGTCSGCDEWEDATDADARTLITSMVTSSRLFSGVVEAEHYCRNAAGSDASEFSHRAAQHLFPVSS